MVTGSEWRVHVYEFDAGGRSGRGAWAVLAADERARATQIDDSVRRARFVTRRAVLRHIVGVYAGRPAARVDLRASGVCFSCSDSGDAAAVAIAPWAVGVDVELETPRRARDRIAARMFAPDERRMLNAVQGDLRGHLFHRCWVAKEAYAKGLGRGLAMRFDRFSVASALGSSDGTGAVRDPGRTGGDWTVALAARGDRHLAVAAPGAGWRLQWRPLPGPALEVCVG